MIKYLTFILLLFAGCNYHSHYSYAPAQIGYGQVVAKDTTPPTLYVRNEWTTFVVNDANKWEDLAVGEDVTVVYQKILLSNDFETLLTGYYFVDARKGYTFDPELFPREYKYLWNNGPCKLAN